MEKNTEKKSGELKHLPVMPRETLELLSPKPGEFFVDGTYGNGGHAELILEAIGEKGQLLGLDRDPQAIQRAKAKFGEKKNFKAEEASYAELVLILKKKKLPKTDGVFLDLGFSSFQIDEATRGFSFLREGPLDMRYGATGPTAAEIISSISEVELADAIYKYGEERFSRRIAKAIVEARRKRKISTTSELAEIISAVLPRRGKLHPATRTFQALRILTNSELQELETFFENLPSCLAKEARVAVISFHSLEDRIVKNAFKALSKGGRGKELTKKPLTASRKEAVENPRSRSAKLRAFQFSQ
jgi:16S rRNA (cytosine1402-N4)-methyltransferase